MVIGTLQSFQFFRQKTGNNNNNNFGNNRGLP